MSENIGPTLAALNACLNGLSFLLLCTGLVLIKQGRREGHKRAMGAAFACSTLFLASYLTRIVLAGDTPFGHEGEGIRTLYLSILASHVILAIAVPPLAIRTVYLAWKERFEAHRRLAKFTAPIWLYVSITGVVVYVMLYQFPGRS